MLYTLENIYSESLKKNPVIISKILGSKDRFKQYTLEKSIDFELSNGIHIGIGKGFEWDLSSVPRLFWTILPPDGDFIAAALIHDFLYQTKLLDRKSADKEMLYWSKKVNGTKKISIKKIDNYTRYFGVRLFGWLVWYRKK